MPCPKIMGDCFDQFLGEKAGELHSQVSSHRNVLDPSTAF